MCRPVYRPEFDPEDEFGPAGVWNWVVMPARLHDHVLADLWRRYGPVSVRLVAWCECDPRDRQVRAVVRRGGERMPVIVGYAYRMPEWLHLVAEHLRRTVTPTLHITSVIEGTPRP
jgi:hypothetical protein